MARAEREAQEIQRTWNSVERMAGDESIPLPKRESALTRFVSGYPQGNPFLNEAKEMLEELREPEIRRNSIVTVAVTSAGLSLPMGGIVEVYRSRSRSFQWVAARLHFAYTGSFDATFPALDEDAYDWESQHACLEVDAEIGAGDYLAYGGGALGFGWKFHLTQSGTHELGFLLFPLSFGIASGGKEREATTFQKIGSLSTDCHISYGVTQYTFAHSDWYYRLNGDGWHLEGGVHLPLAWYSRPKTEWRGEDHTIDPGVYGGSLPLLLYLGGGF